ncbi:type IV secretory system conjugative DNA transfer family protein [Phenylobacterium sp.]|uniref:type IV secretory system conjugative DNA transfer family protein n=1 Tax=Phenylobacterium sp. TaxID=1871053 RepID=UPI003566F6BF
MNRFASAPWPLRAACVGGLGLVSLAALTAITLGVALAGLHQLSAHLRADAVVGWFWYFRRDPEVLRWLKVGAFAALISGGFTAIAITRGLGPSLYGDARWATGGDISRAGLRARRGILLGRSAGQPLVFGGSEHVLLYAPTRSGKGVGVVIPNLLTWPDSTVVLDVKRENWEATAGYRAAHGQRVLLFDPLDPEGRTARFNPLGHVERADPGAVLDELQKLAVMLFPAPPNADPFWAEAARTGFIGVGAYCAATPGLPFSLGAIYRELTDGDPRKRLPQALTARAAAGVPFSPGAVSAISDFCSASDNTFASIKQTLTARLNLWLNPRVCAATDESDFDLRDLRDHRISLYLGVSPDNLARVAPLYNLLFSQLIDLNTRERPTADKHKVPVLVLLDEFARLGHAGVIAHAFAYVAGYGLRLLPVLQSPAQLRAEYGPDLTEEIIANCGAEVVFAPKELKVAQDLSERLGYATVSGRTRSRPSGFSSGRRSLSESDHRRALMLPQELIQMPPDRLIVLKAGAPPVRGRKIAYYRERPFHVRVQAPPEIAPRAPTAPAPAPFAPKALPQSDDLLSLDIAVAALASAGLEPLPPQGAPDADIERWVERFLETTAARDLETENVR